ncbi:MAG: metallophosphoesterase family protein [Fimbriimonadaceae bacterium]|nr:metallophosphoesterase family protein [Fimbriimonadaceae bacterium]
MRIGVLSDTHLPRYGGGLPDELFVAFAGVDQILHAGDLNDLAVLDPLRVLAPVTAVAGNTDPWEVCQALPERIELRWEGVLIGLTHGHSGLGRSTAQRAASWFPAAQVVVFGHSHRPLVEWNGAQLLLNPGSPTDKRGLPRYSCAILTVQHGEAAAELIQW